MIKLLFNRLLRTVKHSWYWGIAIVLSAVLLFTVLNPDNETPYLDRRPRVMKPRSGSFIDSRDGRKYCTLKRGKLWWMEENLNYTSSDRDIGTCYDNKSTACDTYGRLYTWVEAMGLSSSCTTSPCTEHVRTKQKGICPNGWHIPSEEEWSTLTDLMDSEKAMVIRTRNGWKSYFIVGRHGYGFWGATSSGFQEPMGIFAGGGVDGDTACWWSTTSDSANSARSWCISSVFGRVRWHSMNDRYRFSVRCVR